MKKRLCLLTAIFLGLSCFCGAAAAEEPPAAPVGGGAPVTADAIYVNGNIYTVDADFSKAAVIATKGQEILYVGNDRAEAEAFSGAATKQVDLKGKTVIPGIVEGHMHFISEAEKLMILDVFMEAKPVILQKVKEEAAKLKPGEWVTGRGWNQEAWETAEWPSKEDLDAAAPDNPVMLTRSCNHALWVNSMALEMAEVTKDTPDPQGGEILKNAAGEPLGVLTDTAMLLVRNIVPPLSNERRVEGMLKAQEELFSYGITSLMDAGITQENLALTRAQYESGALKIRISEFLFATNGNDKAYIEAGNKPVSGLYDGHLDIRGIKIVSDGSLGARGALLIDDYSDQPGHKGSGRYTDAELYEIVKRAHDNGFQLALHGIGDGAVRQVINAYEKVLKESPKDDHRYRIEHFQIVKPEDIKRAMDLGILPAMQAIHATSDKGMAEDRIGAERIKSAYAWRTVLSSGGIIANGSDAPVELVNPYHGIFAAVTRQDRQGEPDEGWYPEQKMTREEALRSFTSWSAYALFSEGVKGSLEAGKMADFVVLDRDVMTCYEGDIKDAKALMTVLGGKPVYSKDVKTISATFIGNAIDMGEGYILENGVLYVPADKLAEAMEAAYDADGETAEISYKGIALRLRADKSSMQVAGQETSMEAAPIFRDGKLFVPLRDFAGALSLKTHWYTAGREAAVSF
jgi:predicted amidohydrolase YtcJ